MQLNELLDKHSIKEISVKTNISASNLQILIDNEFNRLQKVKTLGFISILEREYSLDLTELKEEALTFYLNHPEGVKSIAFSGESIEEEGTSKLLLFFILFLLGYASWYFFTQFDKKKLSGLLPFNDDKIVEMFTKIDTIPETEIAIESVLKKETESSVVNVVISDEVNTTVVTPSVTAQTNTTVELNTTLDINSTNESNIS